MSSFPSPQPTAALSVRIGWETREARDRALDRYFRPFHHPARPSAPAPVAPCVTDEDQETSLVRYSTWGIWTDVAAAELWQRANRELRVQDLAGDAAIAYRRSVMAGEHPELSDAWRIWRCPNCGWPGWEGMLIPRAHRVYCAACGHVDLPQEVPCRRTEVRIPPQRASGAAEERRARHG